MRWAARFFFLYACCLMTLPAADAPGRLIVGLRRDVDPALVGRTLLLHRAAVRDHLAELGASVLDVPEESSAAILDSLARSGLFAYVERDHYAHTGGVPNDPSYTSQWHLPRIQGPQAWSISTGSAAVVVAVIDSGVYRQHPDLAAKILPGWNFVKNSDDTSDVLGHGTAVAGTLAAATNNGVGVSAVNWASMVMPLVAVDENDFAAYSHIAAAIQYAADHGVRVINISLGGTSGSALLQSAVDYAWERGSVVFASAMNDAGTTPNYPAACNHAVAVSATDTNDRLASYSNFGDWIALSAPGSDILSTMTGGGYGYWYGTSFAAPIAAGVAALALAVNPSLSAGDLVTLLEQNADDLGPQGRDAYFGWGRVNAFRAVQAAQTLAAPAPPPIHRTPHKDPAHRR